MLPTKSRSGLSDTSNNKAIPSTPNHTKITRAKSTRSDSGSPSPLQRSRTSPKSVESKPTIDRRSPRFNISASDKQLLRVNEDLKKAKEQLALVEQEKARVFEELKDAKKLAEEATAAQKGAEERLESEKFRAEGLEQASIDSIRKKEDELESIKKKHSVDVEALHSLSQELEKVKEELEVTTKTKNAAVNQAKDANKIAKTNAEEVSRLKSLLDSKLGSVNTETVEVIKKLESEIDALRHELEVAKEGEERLVIMESLVEKLSTEADNAKSAELDSLKLVNEWQKKAEALDIQLMEAKQSEKSSLESLALVRKQLEESSGSLQDYKFEIATLREKIELLEDQLESRALISKQLEKANVLLQDAESETAVLKGKVESLEIEVADLKNEKLEWKKRAELLEVQVAEANQSKESLSDSLASVTKQLEESHISIQDALTENAALRMKIESLENDITHYKEELMDSERRLNLANEEAIEMGKAIVDFKSEVKTLEEEKLQALNNATFSEERNKLVEELEMARKEEQKAKKAMEGLNSALREVSAEARETQERLFAKRVEYEDAFVQIEQLRLALQNTKENYEVMLDEARYEIVCLKKAIEKFETEVSESKALNFPCEIKEPDEELESTVSSAVDSEEKVNELSAVVAETTTDKSEENGELSNSEKEYDVLPSSKEIPLGSINGSDEEKPKLVEEANGNGNEYLGAEEPVEVEVKMLEGYKAIEIEKGKDFSSELEHEEEFVEELELKMENGSFDNTNGLPLESTEDGTVSPTKHQKKKKPFIRKFGNLLKKKNTHN